MSSAARKPGRRASYEPSGTGGPAETRYRAESMQPVIFVPHGAPFLAGDSLPFTGWEMGNISRRAVQFG